MIYKIGSRKSILAKKYTQLAKSILPFQTKIKYIDSEADLKPEMAIEDMGGKGAFSKSIEEALYYGNIDLAVHAFKDLTRDNDEFLHVPCVLKRNDPRDVLIGHSNPKTIGTSSPRRIAQLQELFPKAEILPIRGNIDTRIQKVENGDYDAIVLAAAGVYALGYHDKITKVFGTAEMLPAPGQGIIAVQSRIPNTSEDKDLTAYCRAVNHIETWTIAMAEKSMLEAIDGDCNTPIGCLTDINGQTLRMVAKNFETDKIRILSGPIEDYRRIGLEIGHQLI